MQVRLHLRSVPHQKDRCVFLFSPPLPAGAFEPFSPIFIGLIAAHYIGHDASIPGEVLLYARPEQADYHSLPKVAVSGLET